MKSTKGHAASRAKDVALLTTVVVTAPLWLPLIAGLVVLVVVVRAVQVASLYAVVWTFWIGCAPRRVLFVYSDSPNWKEHVETRILPGLPANAVVLNWSGRARWRLSLPVLLFRCFAGQREFNPIGLVFERLSPVERYRFWQPFRDARHGRREALELLEARFLRHAAD